MALYFSGGSSGFFSQALRISPVNSTPHRWSSLLTLVVFDLRRDMPQHLADAEVTDDLLAQLDWHRGLR